MDKLELQDEITRLREERDSFQRVGIIVQEENEHLKAKLKLATEELEYIFGQEGWVRIRDVLEKLK